MPTKDSEQEPPPTHTTSNRSERKAVVTREGFMTSVIRQVCAAHHLLVAWELDLDGSGFERRMLMKLRSDLEQLSRHIGDDVPQPAHKSQSGAWSVKRAIGASHGTAGWTCKAACHAADLERLRSARRSLHRELVGAVQVKFSNQCLKGLIAVPKRFACIASTVTLIQGRT